VTFTPKANSRPLALGSSLTGIALSKAHTSAKAADTRKFLSFKGRVKRLGLVRTESHTHTACDCRARRDWMLPILTLLPNSYPNRTLELTLTQRDPDYRKNRNPFFLVQLCRLSTEF